MFLSHLWWLDLLTEYWPFEQRSQPLFLISSFFGWLNLGILLFYCNKIYLLHLFFLNYHWNLADGKENVAFQHTDVNKGSTGLPLKRVRKKFKGAIPKILASSPCLICVHSGWGYALPVSHTPHSRECTSSPQANAMILELNCIKSLI